MVMVVYVGWYEEVGGSLLLIYVFGGSCQEQKQKQSGPAILFQHFNNNSHYATTWTALLILRLWMLLHNYTTHLYAMFTITAADGCVSAAECLSGRPEYVLLLWVLLLSPSLTIG